VEELNTYRTPENRALVGAFPVMTLDIAEIRSSSPAAACAWPGSRSASHRDYFGDSCDAKSQRCTKARISTAVKLARRDDP
jgi:hypothetical protein